MPWLDVNTCTALYEASLSLPSQPFCCWYVRFACFLTVNHFVLLYEQICFATPSSPLAQPIWTPAAGVHQSQRHWESHLPRMYDSISDCLSLFHCDYVCCSLLPTSTLCLSWMYDVCASPHRSTTSWELWQICRLSSVTFRIVATCVPMVWHFSWSRQVAPAGRSLCCGLFQVCSLAICRKRFGERAS